MPPPARRAPPGLIPRRREHGSPNRSPVRPDPAAQRRVRARLTFRGSTVCRCRGLFVGGDGDPRDARRLGHSGLMGLGPVGYGGLGPPGGWWRVAIGRMMVIGSGARRGVSRTPPSPIEPECHAPHARQPVPCAPDRDPIDRSGHRRGAGATEPVGITEPVGASDFEPQDPTDTPRLDADPGSRGDTGPRDDSRPCVDARSAGDARSGRGNACAARGSRREPRREPRRDPQPRRSRRRCHGSTRSGRSVHRGPAGRRRHGRGRHPPPAARRHPRDPQLPARDPWIQCQPGSGPASGAPCRSECRRRRSR